MDCLFLVDLNISSVYCFTLGVILCSNNGFIYSLLNSILKLSSGVFINPTSNGIRYSLDKYLFNP